MICFPGIFTGFFRVLRVVAGCSFASIFNGLRVASGRSLLAGPPYSSSESKANTRCLNYKVLLIKQKANN